MIQSETRMSNHIPIIGAYCSHNQRLPLSKDTCLLSWQSIQAGRTTAKDTMQSNDLRNGHSKLENNLNSGTTMRTLYSSGSKERGLGCRIIELIISAFLMILFGTLLVTLSLVILVKIGLSGVIGLPRKFLDWVWQKPPLQ